MCLVPAPGFSSICEVAAQNGFWQGTAQMASGGLYGSLEWVGGCVVSPIAQRVCFASSFKWGLLKNVSRAWGIRSSGPGVKAVDRYG